MKRELQIKCSIKGHDYIELACLNQNCKANRVYCHQCLKNEDHAAHLKDQRDLKELIEFFINVQKESECLITELNTIVCNIYELFNQLIQGLKKKYQQSKENLLQLNAKQLNQVLDWAINYDENKISLLEDLKKSSDDIIELLNIKITELELEELNKLEQEKEQELYYKRIIFYDDRKQQEVITQLDFTLFNDPINLNEIFPNPYSLRMFGNQDNANIWADQVLSIDSNHVNSLFIKAESLRMLENYNDSIIWADKALSIDSKHVNSLFTKGNSLRKLNKYYEALKFLDQVLIINPNNHTALYSKGAQLLLFRLSLIKRECNIVN